MYHVELSQHPRVVRKFNLGPDELSRLIVVPWKHGDSINLGDHEYLPEQANLVIYEGRELRMDEISMGRGWQNAVRVGEDVTERVLADAGVSGAPPKSATEQFKEAVLAQCGSGRIGIHQVLWLANSQYPGVRMSERMALAEQAVWELLHQGRVRMIGSAGPMDEASWQPTLLAWDTWSGGAHGPTPLLEATGA